jgi:Holliday junction resolvase RusA-like endonuclease
MSDRLIFSVLGEPVGKERARSRVVLTKTGKHVPVHYTPPNTEDYERKVRIVCQAAVSRSRWSWTDEHRFALLIKVFRTHEGKGFDLDNHVKSVSDAINKVAFKDDRYVRHIAAWLQQDAARPRVEVQVVKL